MPTSAKKLVYDFRRKFNATLSAQHTRLALVDIIAYLNEAQEIWFDARLDQAETSSKYRQDLKAFEVKDVCLECQDVDNVKCKSTLPKNHYRTLSRAVIAACGECGKIQKRIPVTINQSDDIEETLRNSYLSASFPYEVVSGDEAGNEFYVYHQNRMSVDKLCINYYRKPKEIHAPELEECTNGYYDYCGRNITKNQDFEGTTYPNAIVDIAVLIARESDGDVGGFQSKLNKIISLQNT